MASGSVWAATGFEYEFDDHTLGLWRHFDEGSGNVSQIHQKNIKAVIKNKAIWNANVGWNKVTIGNSFVFDGQQSVYIPVEDEVVHQLLTSNNEITVKPWIYAQSLDGWKLVVTHYGEEVSGKYIISELKMESLNFMLTQM